MLEKSQSRQTLLLRILLHAGMDIPVFLGIVSNL